MPPLSTQQGPPHLPDTMAGEGHLPQGAFRAGRRPRLGFQVGAGGGIGARAGGARAVDLGTGVQEQRAHPLFPAALVGGNEVMERYGEIKKKKKTFL